VLCCAAAGALPVFAQQGKGTNALIKHAYQQLIPAKDAQEEKVSLSLTFMVYT
jgi:hypothetical protein